MSINDLPNELLDEIFSYVYPWIYDWAVMPINTVCRRWNRPFMTHNLSNTRLPRNIDLQTKFPKLTCFMFYLDAKYYKDFNLFKGHAFLKKLQMNNAPLVASVMDCLRLTSLEFYIDPSFFFKDDNLEVFFALLPRLEYLELYVSSDTVLNTELIQSYNQKLATILEIRPKCQLKLKHLVLSAAGMDFPFFCRLFQTSSLDHFRICNELTTHQALKSIECFPKIRSLQIARTSILSLDIRFEHIKTLQLVSKESVNFSSLLHQFPNAESLEVCHCPILFDLEHPTRLSHLSMSFIGSVQPRFFCHLTFLAWTIAENQFIFVMQELGVNCPLLNTIKIHLLNSPQWPKQNRIVPELDNIVFPSLVQLSLGNCCLKINASVLRFLARHGRLQTVEFRSDILLDDDFKFIESDQLLWPSLHSMCLSHNFFENKSRQPFYNWIFKNAPKLKRINNH